MPEGMSLWYQHIDDNVFDRSNNQGVLPGLWAQISLKIPRRELQDQPPETIRKVC